MHIKNIVLDHFTKHEHTEVVLPDRGVVLVTGENGSGKSSLVEGVSYALWGETLRGTEPWTDGVDGTVVATTDAVLSQRLFERGKKRLHWFQNGLLDADNEYETTTKAQAALEAIIGPWDVWRRTHVFSSQDAAAFTTATDAERKRLLETILGLERFDAALERCRKDLRAAEEAVRRAEVQVERTAGQLGAAEARLSRARAAPQEPKPSRAVPVPLAPPTPPTPPKEPPMPGGLVQLDTLRALADEGRKAFDEADREYERKELTLSAAKERRDAAARIKDTCPMCGQPATAKMKREVKLLGEDVNLAALAVKAATTAREQADGKFKLVHSDFVEAQEMQRENEARVRAHTQWEYACSVLAAQYDANVLRWKKAEQDVEARAALDYENALVAWNDREQRRLDEEAAAMGEVALADEEREEAEHAGMLVVALRAVLQHAETALGLRGIRAHLLGRALAGIEQVANGWLGRVAGPGLRLRLKSTTESKSSGARDVISLEVGGAGGGRGYRGASGGERRRIDVALLLALSEVSAAAHGAEPGTLFFDEVFDALDDDGVSAVADVLAELGRTRAVVVITHNDALAENVRATKRLHVQEGRVM